MFTSHILSYVIFFPLIGAAALLFFRKDQLAIIKTLGLIFSVATFILSMFLYTGFVQENPSFQFSIRVPWIESMGISYFIGLDGLSLMLVMLTTFLTPLAMLQSWRSIEVRVKEYTMMILLLETGILGVFSSLDMFLFYVFWEAMLIPMYFLIGIWGHGNKIYSAVKFFLYTMVGSLLMLIAIIWLGKFAGDQRHIAFLADYPLLRAMAPRIPVSIQTWLFLAFTLSFAIKIPLFPFHTWLPDAHVDAPTAGSVILAGVLLKMGTYGLLRFSIPLFPAAAFQFAPYIAILAVIGIIYGALVSMVQTDMKKLVAYSSVSHLGFIVLGICALTPEALQGSVIQMVNHGLSTGALFLLVGMIYDRRHTRLISEYGGLAKVMPVYCTIFFIVSLSSIGLPGLNGFIGEFLILVGSFKSQLISGWYAVVAATGVIFAAVYLLWMYQRVVFGKVTNPANQNLKDLSIRELFVLVPIIVFIVWIGVYPNTFLKKTEVSVQRILTLYTAQVQNVK
jgi:NADH-quinone oxidoreductase subunit M